EKVVGGERVIGVVSAVAAWADGPGSPSPEAGGAVRRATADAHGMIEATEQHVMDAAAASVVHDASIRQYLLVVLGLACLFAALVIAQGFLLMRRWVVRPV